MATKLRVHGRQTNLPQQRVRCDQYFGNFACLGTGEQTCLPASKCLRTRVPGIPKVCFCLSLSPSLVQLHGSPEEDLRDKRRIAGRPSWRMNQHAPPAESVWRIHRYASTCTKSLGDLAYSMFDQGQEASLRQKAHLDLGLVTVAPRATLPGLQIMPHTRCAKYSTTQTIVIATNVFEREICVMTF